MTDTAPTFVDLAAERAAAPSLSADEVRMVRAMLAGVGAPGAEPLTTYTDPGWVGSVSPGQVVESTWGNAIRDRLVHRFASAAARDGSWPTPPNGAQCVTTDRNIRWQYVAGAGWCADGAFCEVQMQSADWPLPTSDGFVPMAAGQGTRDYSGDVTGTATGVLVNRPGLFRVEWECSIYWGTNVVVTIGPALYRTAGGVVLDRRREYQGITVNPTVMGAAISALWALGAGDEVRVSAKASVAGQATIRGYSVAKSALAVTRVAPTIAQTAP